MANLVICCDGTWSTPEHVDDGLPAPTNVRKLFNALAPHDADGIAQIVSYQPGVGTEGGWWNRLVGGALGDGLVRDIERGYQRLAFYYRPGDRIFLFGFSRGAFTVRSLAGMIGCCGLLNIGEPALAPAEAWRRIDLAFACYRKRRPTTELARLDFHDAPPAVASSAGFVPGAGAATTPIHFIGVWDTVGALGIPDDLAILNLLDDRHDHAFHDTRLGPRVRHARHAVAIDERRQTFTPTFWTKPDGRALEDRDGVKQLWFPGVHSDVGGGYAQTGLSDGALQWMVDEAEQCGLAFRAGVKDQIVPDPRGVVHDSLTGIFAVLKSAPRGVPSFAGADAASRFHASALRRHRDPPLAQGDYWPTRVPDDEPITVDIRACDRWTATHLFLDEGRYRMTASGQWLDGRIGYDPAGKADRTFAPAQILLGISSVLGRAEHLYRRLSGNGEADFWLTRRIEEYPWLALVGVVANGRGIGADDAPLRHRTFLIGSGCTIDIAAGEGGYLHCFANDTWQTCANNHGAVALRVERVAAPATRPNHAPDGVRTAV